MLLPREAQCDEVLVHGIITAATERRVSTVGEFGQFVRQYLAAGYAREVAEAHRQYFNISGRLPTSAIHAGAAGVTAATLISSINVGLAHRGGTVASTSP
jgi:hypothetical protein